MTKLDLREWLSQVEECGQLRRINGAHWNLEVGAASQLNYRSSEPRALLFDQLVDYQSGKRVLTGSVCNAALLGMSLGLGSNLDDAALVQVLRGLPARWSAAAAAFTAVTVPTGPVGENVCSSDDIDLTRFPAPIWHDGDGGRYIGTGCAVITRDYDTGSINVGAYRIQLQNDGRSVSINIEDGKQGAQHIRRWFEAEGRAPIAASLGHHPIFLIAAGTEVPRGISEFDYAGAILESPVEVVEAEVTRLPIPAASELAIEGWLLPGQTRPEGPFGEWTGYYSGRTAPVLTASVERLYFRNDPIILGAPPGKPPHDYSYMRSVMKSAMITDALVMSGLAGVSGVWAHECGGGRLLLAVAIEQRYAGHSRQAGYLAAHHPTSAYMNRFVIVVDDDVDPRDLHEVMWAVSTRCDPAVDIDLMTRTWGSRVDPLHLDGESPYNSRALIDACRPYERLESFPPVVDTNAATLRAVGDKWPELLS